MKIKLGVKQLVDFACRSGDLGGEGLFGPSAREGQIAHKELQSKKTDTQEAEISLKADIMIDDVLVVLGGRIDLLDRAKPVPEIIEIKSTYMPPGYLSASVIDMHWAQLKVYGYMLSLKTEDTSCEITTADELRDIQRVCLQLACHNLLEAKTYRDTQEFTVEELKKFTLDALQRYVTWFRAVEKKRELMRESATEMQFPFGAYRDGQYRMAASAYLAIKHSERLLCEAPTGTGKTISTLFPACKALAEGHVSQVVYLTAKTSGREAAFSAIGNLEEAGLKATSLVIHSKALACHCHNGSCERNEDGRCPRTIGFFDRLPDARDELLSVGRLDNQTIDKVALVHDLCPFELALQMLPWMDLVVCDYNYVFDPLVRLTSFAERESNLAFLVDEAHNLSDRARNMYSAELSHQQNLDVAESCKHTHPAIAKAARSLNRVLARYSKSLLPEPGAGGAGEVERESSDAPDSVTKAVEKCLESLAVVSPVESFESAQPGSQVSDLFTTGSTTTENTQPGGWPEIVRDWYKALFRYQVIEEIFSEHHRTLVLYSRAPNSNSVARVETLKLACLDASERLEKSFARVHSAVVFSATLRPNDYYLSTLGLENKAKSLSLPSPFKSDQLACVVCGWVDTRYRARQQSAPGLVELICQVYRQRPGNYLVFFPSYAYMEDIQHRFKDAYPEIPLQLQLRGGQQAAADFLAGFSSDSCTLGFAIMGGVFGEGIDFPGEQLVGAIIVGTGLPGLGLEQNLLSRHYASRELDGFDYAFRFPGFTRVQQTAGRVIRTESDRGIVLLVDSRFETAFYRSLYPDFWSPRYCHTHDEVAQVLGEFWETEGVEN